MVIAELDKLKLFGNDSQERIEKALTNLQNGNGIILIDDIDRENEGDLIFSAHNMTIDQMALMIKKCSGIVCLCLTGYSMDTAPHSGHIDPSVDFGLKKISSDKITVFF